MDRAERNRLREFIDAYDRGTAGEGIKVPDFVVEGLRETVELVEASDTQPCFTCDQEGTWVDGEGRVWCPAHPDYDDQGNNVFAAQIWMKRYYALTDCAKQAMVRTTLQEARTHLEEGLTIDDC